MSFETSVGTSDADSITVMGRDLSKELLGAGSVFLGVVEETAAFLARIAARADGSEDGLRAAAEEEVKAFVVLRGGADLADVRERAARRLARFKVPRYLEAVAELPHTPTGRVAKHELSRERTAAEIDFDAPTGKATTT